MKWVKNEKIILSVIAMFFLVMGCNKYPDPPMVYEAEPEIKSKAERKVLLISIDGLAGTELENYIPENLSKILKHSKYSLSGFTVEDTGDAASWTSLMSGVSTRVHGIHGNDFDLEFDEDDPHGHNNTSGAVGFTTAFQRITESGQKLRSYAVTSWDLLSKNVNELADTRYEVANDQVAKDSLINQLKRGVKREAFYLLNFRSLNQAGSEGGFSMENTNYKNSLNTLDTYIGEILATIEKRNTYEKEDWLIVITSNHGGIGTSYGGASHEERKVPIIFYNPKFSELQFTIPPFTNGFKARNGINGSISAVDAARYNIGTSGEYTIQLKLMVHQFGTLNPAIISKQNNTGNADDGWSFIHNGGVGWRLKVKGTHVVAGTPTFEVGKWYTLTARIYMDGTTRKAQVFTDGALITDASVGTVQGTSTANLNLGYSASYVGGTLIQSVKDVVIYNTALPIEYIQNNYCKSPIDNTYQSNMIGSWSIGDGLGNKLKNSITDAPDFTLNGAYTWEFMQDDFCKLLTGKEDTSKEKFLQTVDVLPQLFYWLNIKPQTAWNLEGELFLNKYEEEFLKD